MCKYGTHASVTVSGVTINTIDACIAPIVQALNNAGIETVASCCGHGNCNGVISLSDGREILIARNWDEARLMERVIGVDIHGVRYDQGI